MELPENAALTIARWCWPEAHAPGATEAMHSRKDRAIGHEMMHEWPLIRAAELVLIERVGEEPYGRELDTALSLLYDGPGARYPLAVRYSNLAKAATAPLDARCRAMLATIKNHERAQADPG